MKSRPSIILIALALFLPACSDDSGGTTDSGMGDLTTAGDIALTDQTVTRDGAGADQAPASDLAIDDQTLADSTPPDASTEDARSDAPVPDSSPDSEVPDASAADLTSPDTGADQGQPQGACAQGAVPQELVADKVVICELATSNIDQCAAAQVCAAGWHLCTASEYQGHFSASAPPITLGYWLAGCIRDGGDTFDPSDTVCSACAGATGSEEEIGWGCTMSITILADELHVGMRASSACSIAGVNDVANEAYWLPWPSNKLLPGAVCCK